MLVPANERERHEPQHVQVGCHGDDVQDDVVEHQEHMVDRVQESFGGKL